MIIIIAICIMGIVFVKIRRMGLYLTKNELYEKGMFRCTKINIDKIAGIVIIKSQFVNHLYGYYLKDLHNEYQYSAVFVDEIKPGMKSYCNGDMSFLMEFKKSTLCYSVYDSELIERICRINPKILVIDERTLNQMTQT